ncbi:hypothetical protein Hanom_Chr15g01405791 [Helianthus anomalus]
MMLRGKVGQKMKPVLREKNKDYLVVDAPLWRMFCPYFEGNIEIVKCGPDEEGWYDTIVGNFRVPDEATLNALLPQGKGKVILGRWETPATGVPSAPVTTVVDKHKQKNKTQTPVTIPSLVPDASGTFRPRLCKYEDYVVVSDTIEGLSVPGASSRASGVTAGTKPFIDKKRKGDTDVDGGEKAPKLRKTRTTMLPKHKPSGTVQLVKESISASSLRSSPSKV